MRAKQRHAPRTSKTFALPSAPSFALSQTLRSSLSIALFCAFSLSFSPSFFFCSWNILFLLRANKFDVALCLIPFQACSCFGNRRKKIPITNQIKAHSMKRNWKQQASKRPAHEMPCSGFQRNSNQKHIIIIWNSPPLTRDRWWVITHASLINKFQH